MEELVSCVSIIDAFIHLIEDQDFLDERRYACDILRIISKVR